MLTALFWLGWAALSSSWTKMYSSSIVLRRKCCEEVAWRVCWCAIFYNSRSINFLLYCRRLHLVITTKNKSKNNYVWRSVFHFNLKKKIFRLDFFFLFRPRQKKKVDVFKRESWMGLTSMEMVAQSGARAHSVFAFDFFWKQLFFCALKPKRADKKKKTGLPFGLFLKQRAKYEMMRPFVHFLAFCEYGWQKCSFL